MGNTVSFYDKRFHGHKSFTRRVACCFVGVFVRGWWGWLVGIVCRLFARRRYQRGRTILLLSSRASALSHIEKKCCPLIYFHLQPFMKPSCLTCFCGLAGPVFFVTFCCHVLGIVMSEGSCLNYSMHPIVGWKYRERKGKLMFNKGSSFARHLCKNIVKLILLLR